MAKTLWKPDGTAVRDQEIIGRRIYVDKVLQRQIDRGESATLRLDHFYDNRLENDLSVDRLSQSGSPNRRVVGFLRPIASGVNPGSSFFGWGALKVASLRRFHGAVLADVLASPIMGNDEQEYNPYHADILRDDFREHVQALSLAFTLRDIAESDIGIVGTQKKPSKQQPGFLGQLTDLVVLIRELLQSLFK